MGELDLKGQPGDDKVIRHESTTLKQKITYQLENLSDVFIGAADAATKLFIEVRKIFIDNFG